MAPDDLNAPLGQKTKKQRRPILSVAVPQIIVGTLGMVVLSFGVWALIGHDPLGGEPMVVVTANPASAPVNPDGNLSGVGNPNRYDGPAQAPSAPTLKPDNPPESTANPEAKPTPGMRTITIIDGTSGRRQQIEIPAPPESSSTPVEQKMLDSSRHGAIPKVGPDGTRPMEAYARAASLPAGKTDSPRIAIVISGLGVSVTNTNEALAKLPGPVTLAFSPYAGDVERVVARARADGHEVLLQIPMEPFDYPDTDPGPQTLLTTLLADQNLDRLHWLMSRFQGYVGVMNVMGSKFTASERALTPVLYEITKRGLIYLDDGVSPRSLASQIAGTNRIPFAKAEVQIDAVATPGNIDRALSRLEALARERGSVVGFAAASPAVIERIAQWAKGADGRGIVLVPISVIANKPKAT